MILYSSISSVPFLVYRECVIAAYCSTWQCFLRNDIRHVAKQRRMHGTALSA